MTMTSNLEERLILIPTSRNGSVKFVRSDVDADGMPSRKQIGILKLGIFLNRDLKRRQEKTIVRVQCL